ATARPGLVCGLLHALGLASHERHLGPSPRELDRGGATDAPRGAGDQHEGHGATVAQARSAHQKRAAAFPVSDPRAMKGEVGCNGVCPRAGSCATSNTLAANYGCPTRDAV